MIQQVALYGQHIDINIKWGAGWGAGTGVKLSRERESQRDDSKITRDSERQRDSESNTTPPGWDLRFKMHPTPLVFGSAWSSGCSNDQPTPQHPPTALGA